MRFANAVCLILPTSLLALGCSAPPPDTSDIDVPTAPEVADSMSAGSGPGPADPDAPEDFTTTSSGLKYRVLRVGSGGSPSASDTVLCHYRGWLDDGTEFDSSYSRGQPIDFPLNGVIDGWTEGLQFVREGGMIELEIPYQIGYGEGGMPPTIPPRATLHFTVELIEIL